CSFALWSWLAIYARLSFSFPQVYFLHIDSKMHPNFLLGRTPTATNWPDGSAVSAVFPWFPWLNGPNSESMPTRLSPLLVSWMINWQAPDLVRACKRRRGN